MKKLIPISLISLIVSTLVIMTSCGNQSSNEKSTVAVKDGFIAARVDSVSLNGYTFAEAEILVRNFLKNGFSAEKQTSIWFSKTYIDTLDSVLTREGADGIRIYFARKDKKNELVIVSTMKSKNLHPRDSTPTHRDNFVHKSNFFQPGNNSHILGLSENGVPEARLHAAAGNDCANLPCNSSGHAISCEQGHRWVNQFKQEPFTTSSIWYSIELLHSWKQELGRAVVNGLKGDGIRIYFAKNDKNKNVLVFTTTRENNKKRTDFYDCASDITRQTSPGGNGFVADNGEECPNNCNDVTWQ